MVHVVYNIVRDGVNDATPPNGPVDAGAPRGGPQHTTPDGVTLRRCATRDDFLQCVALQAETWGDGFTDKVPVTILELAQRLGGVTAGAFDPAGRLLGFVFGMAGRLGRRPVHWSDILAVRPDGRDRGLGTRLKHYQRELLRDTEAEAIYWTFDPLIARNAHLNLTRLGARAVQYVRDMYGPDTGSALHSGLGTDRLVAEWPLRADAGRDGAARDATSAGSVSAVGGASWDAAPVVNPPDAAGRPAFAPADAPAVRVAIPADIHGVLREAPGAAGAWRESTRDAFEWYLARGYAVAGFAAERGRGGAYHLTRPAGGEDR